MSIAVARRRDRPARAEHLPLVHDLPMAGVVIGPLPECAVLEDDLAEHCVLAGWFDRCGHGRGPALVEAAGASRVARDPHLLEAPHLTKSAAHVSKVVLEDIGIVDADVQC